MSNSTNAVYLLLWLSSQLENRHVVCKASAVELRMLPHTRNLVIIRELEKVSEILDYNISLMRIIPDFVLMTFSVTWGYSSLEFGPTSFGSQSPEYLAALYGFSIIFVNMTTSDCSVKGTGSLLLLYFFDHLDHLLVHLNEHEEALGL